MARWISLARIVVATIGVFLGFYFVFGGHASTAIAVVAVTTVGLVGVLAFVGHVIFYKADARRLGWETDRPDWMFEVGFANLAFACMALLAVIAGWGVHAQALTVLGFALYLLQAAILHGYRYFTDEERSPARLWRSFLLTLLVAAMMTFLALYALLS
ncbi:MAG: DUF6790 family protein [Actinomycetes bacterium]